MCHEKARQDSGKLVRAITSITECVAATEAELPGPYIGRYLTPNKAKRVILSNRVSKITTDIRTDDLITVMK